jgi:hypothetical protein
MTTVTDVEQDDAVELKRKPRNKVDVAIVGYVNLNGPVRTPGTTLYPVPREAEFGSSEFMEDDALQMLADILINQKHNLVHLKGMSLRYYWKRKGGTSGGSATLGKCLKPSGLVRHLSDTDFIIWLAADNCAGLSKHEVEALLFHELCHAGRNEEGNRVLFPHDVQDFLAVIREYGTVTPELRAMRKAMKQLSLDDAES